MIVSKLSAAAALYCGTVKHSFARPNQFLRLEWLLIVKGSAIGLDLKERFWTLFHWLRQNVSLDPKQDFLRVSRRETPTTFCFQSTAF